MISLVMRSVVRRISSRNIRRFSRSPSPRLRRRCQRPSLSTFTKSKPHRTQNENKCEWCIIEGLCQHGTGYTILDGAKFSLCPNHCPFHGCSGSLKTENSCIYFGHLPRYGCRVCHNFSNVEGFHELLLDEGFQVREVVEVGVELDTYPLDEREGLGQVHETCGYDEGFLHRQLSRQVIVNNLTTVQVFEVPQDVFKKHLNVCDVRRRGNDDA